MTGAAGPFIVRLQRPCEACGQELEYVDGENPHWRGHGDSEDAPGWEPGPDPYCVREDEPDGGAPPLSVKAVAALDGENSARYHAVNAVRLALGHDLSEPWPVEAMAAGWLEAAAACDAIEPAGRVPLPDGSEIHVEATSWRRLVAALGDAGWADDAFLVSFGADDYPAILDAWNSRFGVAVQEKEGTDV